MTKKSLTRQDIRDVFIGTLKPLPYIHAMWEAGSIAFGRDDEWSDIDLQIVVDDKKVEKTFLVIENLVRKLGGHTVKFRMLEPAWHGHSQVFYVLKNASPYLYLDICVMKKGAKDKFLQQAIHGTPIAHFDKGGWVRNDPVDIDEFAGKIMARLETMKNVFRFSQVLTLKELNRGRLPEAHGFYMGSTLRPLVEALRMKHSPYHYNFHMAYITFDLPKRDVEQLKRLILVKDSADLRKKHTEAGKWFWKTVKLITENGIKKKLKEIT
jgi:predicted nucleotidyltransferase